MKAFCTIKKRLIEQILNLLLQKMKDSFAVENKDFLCTIKKRLIKQILKTLLQKMKDSLQQKMKFFFAQLSQIDTKKFFGKKTKDSVAETLRTWD